MIEFHWIMCAWPLSMLIPLVIGFRLGVWATKKWLETELKKECE